jgi:hypothetical protein
MAAAPQHVHGRGCSPGAAGSGLWRGKHSLPVAQAVASSSRIRTSGLKFPRDPRLFCKGGRAFKGGIAQMLLAHACEVTRQHGRLRLDCVRGRPKLSAVYQRFGFWRYSDKQLGLRLCERNEIEDSNRAGSGR